MDDFAHIAFLEALLGNVAVQDDLIPDAPGADREEPAGVSTPDAFRGVVLAKQFNRRPAPPAPA